MLRIKLAEPDDLEDITLFCGNSLLGTKIMCSVNAYGLSRDFLSVWCCIDEEKTVAVICKFEDSITLLCEETEYTDDIKTFLGMVGFSSLCCTADTADRLKLTDVITKRAYMYSGIYDGEVCGELSEEYYRDCYSLISKSIPDSFSDTKEAYMYFLSDFTYRKRRNMARIKGCIERGKVYSCALTSGETDTSAIISGVACDSECRKTGLGKKTVLTLAEELKKENKSVYVIALNESAEGFYEHIGFTFTEKISFIERK